MGSMREAEKLSFGMVGMVLDLIGKGLSSPLSIAKALAETFSHDVEIGQVRQKITYAYRRGYLKRFGTAGAFHYQLSPVGEQRLAQLSFRLIRFDPAQWDGLWRVLIFDIPESRRTQRDMVRHLIRQLGMKPLQKSVWLTPAGCKNEFEQLRQAYGIDQNDLFLLEVKNSTPLESFKKYWW